MTTWQPAHILAPKVTGLKMYLDQTFGPLRLDDLDSLMKHMERWPADRPVLCHAEGRTVAACILVAHLTGKHVNICHASRADEIDLIRRAKEKGIHVTCEVTPHHFFLTDEIINTIGFVRSEVRPRLAKEARSTGAAIQPGSDRLLCDGSRAAYSGRERLAEDRHRDFPDWKQRCLCIWSWCVKD